MPDMTPADFLPPAADADTQELGTALRPRFDAAGLVTAVVTDADSGDVVMLAHMNAEALHRTLATGIATYWSRSRGALWIKGETSGNRQHVTEIRVDCDQDALWLKVRTDGHGAACHQGYHSCFYRRIVTDATGTARLETLPAAPVFDPKAVYTPG